MKRYLFPVLAIASPLLLATSPQLKAADVRETEVFFEHNEASLDPAGAGKISDVAAFLESCRGDRRTYVYGFHDLAEEEQTNRKLSDLRAGNVARVLISLGAEPEGITVTGHAASFGLETAAGRSEARNRVVLVEAYCSTQSLPAQGSGEEPEEIEAAVAEPPSPESEVLAEPGVSEPRLPDLIASAEGVPPDSETEARLEAVPLRALPQAVESIALAAPAAPESPQAVESIALAAPAAPEPSVTEPSASELRPSEAALPTVSPTEGLEGETKLEVLEFLVAEDVVDREPLSPKGGLVAGKGPLIAFARIRNKGAPSQVSFVWQYRDSEVARFDTKVGTSVRWRTWSAQKIWPGAWRVLLKSADGKTLSEISFDAD